MKRKVLIFVILLCALMIHIASVNGNVKTVLLAGTVIGFDVDDGDEENKSSSVVRVSTKTIGTMTFIDEETNSFAALGHSTMDDDETVEIEGTCYEANVRDVSKSENNNAGHLIATVKQEKKIGEIYKNSCAGIFGSINNVQKEQYEEIDTASRYQVKKGKANILIKLDGENLESYDVEIVGIDYLNKNKNIRIKVTDRNLIEKTGGIVQGMSGTPLVQNGKLVGAINYVNIEDSKEAYAIFIDKLF